MKHYVFPFMAACGPMGSTGCRERIFIVEISMLGILLDFRPRTLHSCAHFPRVCFSPNRFICWGSDSLLRAPGEGMMESAKWCTAHFCTGKYVFEKRLSRTSIFTMVNRLPIAQTQFVTVVNW